MTWFGHRLSCSCTLIIWGVVVSAGIVAAEKDVVRRWPGFLYYIVAVLRRLG